MQYPLRCCSLVVYRVIEMNVINQTSSTEHLQLTRQGARVQGKKRLAIRDSFIRGTGPRLVRARQHHAFKLFLLALWCFYPRGRPCLRYDLENKHLAALVGIGRKPDSRRSAAGHVLAVLEKQRLIRRAREGQQRIVIVCHESGDGREYTQPKGGGPNAYVELPGEFFANGWLNRLSAPAILVMLIALREQRFLAFRRKQRRHRNTSFDWFQPVTELVKRYGIGATTIEKGLRELKAYGFLTTRLTARHPQHGGLVAPRNLYSNHPETFEVGPNDESAEAR